jgi:DNA polymerase III alpha subunit
LDEFPEMFELAEQLSGRVSNYSDHASAVVIGDVDLSEFLPARASGDTVSENKKVHLSTQAEMREVEKAGFPKFDFLGLRNLDVIMRAALLSGDFHDEGITETEERRSIIQYFRHGIDWESEPEEMWNQFDRGYTLGLFQVEQGFNARKIARRLRPRSIEDLAPIVALNRPGPLRSRDEEGKTAVERFLDRREGRERPTYPHEILESILAPTYGLFIYQEAVIAYFREIGYSLSDADHIRKILGKKLVEEMQAEYPTYKKHALQYMSEQTAEYIWQLIEDFSKYSFNKAHSVGYGMISGWTAYAKYRWPAAYVIASIETLDDTDKVVSWVHESRRLNNPVSVPNLFKSGKYVEKKGGMLLYGLTNIKGLGESVAEWIIQHRENWFDSEVQQNGDVTLVANIGYFLHDCKEGGKVNKGHLKRLSAVGALDGAFSTRIELCSWCDGEERYRPPDAPPRSRLQDCPYCLFGWDLVPIPPLEERIVLEEELLGIVVTDIYADLVKEHQAEIDELGPIGDATIIGRDIVDVPGIVVDASKHKTKTEKKPYWKLKLYWRGEYLPLFIWSDKVDEFEDRVCKQGVLAKWTLQQTTKGEPKFKAAFKYGEIVQEEIDSGSTSELTEVVR